MLRNIVNFILIFMITVAAFTAVISLVAGQITAATLAYVLTYYVIKWYSEFEKYHYYF